MGGLGFRVLTFEGFKGRKVYMGLFPLSKMVDLTDHFYIRDAQSKHLMHAAFTCHVKLQSAIKFYHFGLYPTHWDNTNLMPFPWSSGFRASRFNDFQSFKVYMGSCFCHQKL